MASESEPTLPKGFTKKSSKKVSKKEKQPEPKQTTPKPEPNELGIASFVDKLKDPQSYVNRYNNEASYKKWFDDNHSNYSSIYAAVGLEKPKPKTKLEQQFMRVTTVVAFFTAVANLTIIILMNTTDGLDLGLGLAAIGIITFFGVSLSSSIFEEHRHEHGNKKKSNLISNIVVGKGIMRKGLAASLVMTYIVLIGFSFSAVTLADSFNDKAVTTIVNGTSLNNSTISSSSQDVNTNIVIKDIVTLGEKVKSLEASILAKESTSLVQHFTIVISVVLGFYFASNALNTLLTSRKENQVSNDSSEILKVRLAKSEISEAKYKKLKKLIKE